MSKKTSLCFVCTGNTCRSPMAQFILKNKISAYLDMDLKITSFGINVTETEINPLAKNALKIKGYKMTKFVPKQITLEKVKGFDAIVTMTDKMMGVLIKQGYKNVYSVNQLTKLGDVIDPFGGGQKDYNQCCEMLEKVCDILVSMLKEVL